MRLLPALLAVAAPVFAQSFSLPIRGFPQQDWTAQHDREEHAKAISQAARLRAYMERMASSPHVAGSPASKAVADYLASQLREWGLDVHIETFDALMPYPTARLLEMTAPVKFRAELKEPPIAGDPATSEPGAIPTYNAYSASGDVTAQLVYVNYGLPQDYAALKREGVEVKGRIVIARYGRGWRGVKVKLAQEYGAAGCLIYSDPHEDGYFQGDPYPDGPMRPAEGVQRGSVLDMGLYPGDPLSPGWSSEEGARRLPLAEAKSLPKIPVLPISWADAKPLLQHLGGKLAPESWRGSLPITYHLGAGPAVVHLKVDFDWSSKPLYDVIATIPGTEFKDQQILYGNHHDAWVSGASDPASGAAVVLETARTLSVLLHQGWRPKRTITFALWDGEEFGLMGSTEWTEKHLAELQRTAAVYINSDNTGRGPLAAGGSASLQEFMAEVLRDVSQPDGTRSLLDAANGRPQPVKGPEGLRLAPLGFGSDYVPFLDHAGIASLNLGFTGGDAGVYHSVYDTLDWFDRYSDGTLGYGKTLTEVMTASLLRLADAPVLPFEFTALSRDVGGYVEEIQRAALKQSPKQGGALDLRTVQMEVAHLEATAKTYDEQLNLAMKRGSVLSTEHLAKVDEVLTRVERTLLSPQGLPGREWYRNVIYAPGLYTGYDAKTLPGIREAVEAQRYDIANQQARHLTQALRALSAQIDEAAALLK